jgi:cell filamentation protein
VSGDPYVYPNTQILRNKLGIRNAARLEYFERVHVAQRTAEDMPNGDFDLYHLCAIHRHLFQDVYDWAGEVRRVSLAKGGSHFQPPRFIPAGMADVHRRLAEADFLRGLDNSTFAEAAAPILGDVNYIHPFREGNGRTQLQYFKLLARNAGHKADLTRLDPVRWLAASQAAHNANYALMTAEIVATLGSR